MISTRASPKQQFIFPLRHVNQISLPAHMPEFGAVCERLGSLEKYEERSLRSASDLERVCSAHDTVSYQDNDEGN